jgi:hypothetical protein
MMARKTHGIRCPHVLCHLRRALSPCKGDVGGAKTGFFSLGTELDLQRAAADENKMSGSLLLQAGGAINKEVQAFNGEEIADKEESLRCGREAEVIFRGGFIPRKEGVDIHAIVNGADVGGGCSCAEEALAEILAAGDDVGALAEGEDGAAAGWEIQILMDVRPLGNGNEGQVAELWHKADTAGVWKKPGDEEGIRRPT